MEPDLPDLGTRPDLSTKSIYSAVVIERIPRFLESGEIGHNQGFVLLEAGLTTEGGSEIATRRICFAGCTSNPDEDWMLQVGRNLTDAEDGFLKGKRYLLMDRDTKYGESFRSMVRSTW